MEGAGLLANLGIKERTVLGVSVCLDRWGMRQFKQSLQQQLKVVVSPCSELGHSSTPGSEVCLY